jgi:hypothetical protein
MVRRPLLAVAVIGVLAAPVAGQSRFPLSFQASGAAVKQIKSHNLDGSTGGNYPVSVGFEGQFRYSTATALSIGVGAQFSDLGDYDGTRLLIGFVEPRLRINVSSGKVGPYLTARIGGGRITYIDPDDHIAPYERLSKNGVSIGGGVGFLYRFSRRIGLDLGVLINGSPQPVASYVLGRFGFSIGLGQPRRL